MFYIYATTKYFIGAMDIKAMQKLLILRPVSMWYLDAMYMQIVKVQSLLIMYAKYNILSNAILCENVWIDFSYTSHMRHDYNCSVL